MSKVYVVQETMYDFRGAEEFGELTFLSLHGKDDFYNIANSQHNERLIAHLRQGLRSFDPENDWLLFVGSPYVQVATAIVLGQMRVSKVRILRWDNRDRQYLPLILNLQGE